MNPMKSDPPPFTGDGYEVKLFDAGVGEDPDLAWSRINLDDPTAIEISFKKDLLGETEIFLWGAWATLGDDPFPRFDHHDYYTFETAGSPMKSETRYYPLKDMHSLDNTCRAASGYTPKGGEPGLCPIPKPPVAEEEPGPNCRRVCTGGGLAAPQVCTIVCD